MNSEKNNKKRILLIIFTCVKYLFAVAVTIAGTLSAGHLFFIVNGLVELILICLISEFLVSKCRVVGIIVNDILLFIFDLQFLVMFFARTFTTTVMIENLDSIQDQAGNFLQYGIGVAVLVIFSFLPITQLFQTKKVRKTVILSIIFALAALAEVGFVFWGKANGSPWVNAYTVTRGYIEKMKFRKGIEENAGEMGDGTLDKTSQFYKEGIDDDRKKPDNLPERPNVVLIFTEGLSSNIIDDSRAIMPEVRKLQEEAITFDRYYNHTFATYRALIGSLYSGYQLENQDENHLVSLQSILKKNGYHTIMINVEPYNSVYTEYLDRLGFDEVPTSFELHGTKYTISDVDAYRMLFEIMENEPSDTPFFICLYTVGTHESFGSTGVWYGETEEKELDKFYNVDKAFGEFMDSLKNSKLHDNTVVVFTADHATYGDREFSASFPDKDRPHSMIDEMPLVIYYKGVKQETIDVGGRNTLCLTPTILDLLDISDENMFLGSSLFSDVHTTPFETCTVIDRSLANTKDGIIAGYPADEKQALMEQITAYFKEKLR